MVTLALSPATKTAAVEETVSIGAMIQTNTDTIAAAELHLTYDPTAIRIQQFTPAQGPVVLTPEAHTNGAISVVLGVPPTNPFKGAGIIGTWTATILAAKQTSIQFASTTQVAALGKTTNALASATGSTITGTVTGTPAPTPTITAYPTNTPTPSPTLTPGLSPTPTPNPADIDKNGKVNIIDYTLYMSAWFLDTLSVVDLNHDGKKSAIDYTIFMNGWNDYNQNN